ncbi:hypothetical protein [Prochlorococcus sp. MIT 1300]|uniref:hypothetical protein n=1 Tax=Prochlorococcus sp. MIT 1300 TaxID=3096218 RepID=UPI002A764024|nr:hypothetical protein [Prochlorococcus sp. MIT 1300]
MNKPRSYKSRYLNLFLIFATSAGILTPSLITSVNAKAPQFRVEDGRFIYFVITNLAAKAICMEKVTEIPKGAAFKHFENVLLKKDPPANLFYQKYIKDDKESFEEFVETTLNDVMSKDIKYESKYDSKYNTYEEDGCKGILTSSEGG